MHGRSSIAVGRRSAVEQPVVPLVSGVPVDRREKAQAVFGGVATPVGAVGQDAEAEVVDAAGRGDEVSGALVVDVAVPFVELGDVAADPRVETVRVVKVENVSELVAKSLLRAVDTHDWVQSSRTNVVIYASIHAAGRRRSPFYLIHR